MSNGIKHLILELVKRVLPLIIAIVVAYIESRNIDEIENDYICDIQDDYMTPLK